MPRKRKRGSLTVKRKYHYITSEKPKEENHVACEPLVNIKATTDSSTQSESENMQFTSDHSYAIDEDSTYELDSFQETNNDKPEADVMECSSGLLEMEVETTTFSDFDVELKLQNISSQFVVKESEQSIQMLQLYANDSLTAIKLSVEIKSDFMCSVYLHRKCILRSHQIWTGLPQHINRVAYVLVLLERLLKFDVCIGNPEVEFSNLVPIGSGLSSNNSPEIVAYREGDFNATHASGERYNSTIRSVKCDMLSTSKKCTACKKYFYLLQSRKNRVESRLNSCRKYSHTNFKHRDMTKQELNMKLNEQKHEIKNLQTELWKQRREFDKIITANGISVEGSEHHELKDLMASCETEFEKSFPISTSRQRLFWEQQMSFVLCVLTLY
ncbi:hypothetical protein DPMN_109575 [Dreissena polymorpha]|uniref:Uncharacterized protein n=1 Tax=Dreissena polymorpha TaxID=45954 RepID=A0A9D4QN51_DREPO|nr:hypothetical protein DPMN_109575 [Dreissena polymorpha]